MENEPLENQVAQKSVLIYLPVFLGNNVLSNDQSTFQTE